jgi:hypothetical protein
MPEIRCYGRPHVANGLVLVIAIGLLLMVVAGVLDGNYFGTLTVAVTGYFVLGVVWLASRRGTFIAVDPNTKTLRASNFFFRTKPIPIDSITHIGTRGMFVGAATEIEITYRKQNGQQKTVGYGTKTFFNHKDLRKLLDAIVSMNAALSVPAELRK